ncbi:MAG: ABC transporter substrate-binding protein [Alsobacter sp.]
MRAVVFAVLVLLTGIATAAAQAPVRLAVLSPIASSEGAVRTWVLPELARAGFVEGRNLVVDFRIGSLAEFPALARAIVAEKPSAIISISGGPLGALRAETTTIPIVSAGGDPVGLGLAASMSRPGGNVTGFVISGADLDAKRMELLGQILGPGVPVAGMLLSNYPTARLSEPMMREAAQQGGFAPVFVTASGPADYERAIRDVRAAGARGLVVTANPVFARDTTLILDLAAKAGLATACEWRDMAERGCLVGYGPSRAAFYQGVGRKVALLLRGASPAEMPIERPTLFELVINQRTARSLGLDLPATILGRADEVFD